MDMIARVDRKPSLDRRVLMSRVVVQDHMDIEVLRYVLLNVLEELNKFVMAMPRQALFNDLTVQGIECREERGGSMAHVVVSLPSWNTRTQRQDRCGPIQGLHTALFINAQHDRVCWRIHVKPDHVAQLFCEMRVSTELEAFKTMRLKVMSKENPLNGTPTDAVLLRQLARAPMRGVFWRCCQNGLRDFLRGLRADEPRAAWTRRIGKHALQAVLFKAPPHFDHILPRNAHTARYIGVRKSISCRKYHLSSKNRTMRSRRTACQFHQGLTHFRFDNKAISSMIRHTTILPRITHNCNAFNGSAH